MSEEYRPLARALGARRTHVVLVHLLQQDRAVETHASSQPRDDADHRWQQYELPRGEAPAVAGERKVLQDLAQKKLAGDDVDDVVDAHQEHAQERPPEVKVGSP